MLFKKKTVVVALLFSMLSSMSRVNAQTNVQDIEKRFTPSPVAASLGSFGGITDVKKSSGGLNTSIPLFKLNQGDIEYSPSLEYFSTGVRVNDWGGRLGMSWTDDFTCSITRVINSKPDEYAGLRIDLPPDQMDQYTYENLNRVKMIVDATSPMQGVDAEYDTFTYNIFGEVGSFIIKNKKPVLLNHSKPVKIDLVGDTPYMFCITRPDGMKFYFGLNEEVEKTSYSGENFCDALSPLLQTIPTAWFLSKIVSPTKQTVNFTYSMTKASYLYDERENISIHLTNDGATGCSTYGEAWSEHVFCTRQKTSETPLLTAVSCESFEVGFQYIDRKDLIGDKLLQTVTVRNATGELVNKLTLDYNHIISTSHFEEMLEHDLARKAEDADAIKHRYFLTFLQIGYPNVQTYKFEYNSPSLLPHRFSLGQDVLGFYNGYSNNGFIPAHMLKLYLSEDQDMFLPFRINTGTRIADSLSARYGVIQKISYPTGGYDIMHYELNTRKAVETIMRDTTVSETVKSNASSSYWEHAASLFYLPVKGQQVVSLNIGVDYDSKPLPVDFDQELYYVEFMLYNITDETVERIPESDSNGIVSRYMLKNYSYPLYLSGEKEYQLFFKVHNYHTMFTYSVKHLTSSNVKDVDAPFYGVRVSKIETYSLNSQKRVRTFSYKTFTQNQDKLNFGTFSSLDAPQEINGYAKRITILTPETCPHNTGYMTKRENVYVFSSQNNYRMEIYNGLAYSYSCVTEFFDEAQSSFISSQFQVASNESGGVLIGDYTPAIPLSNLGWNNGLELKRFYGYKRGSTYEIRKEQNWNYKQQSQEVTHNYQVINYGVSTNRESSIIWEAFQPYTVLHYPLYSTWYTLNSIQEKNFEGSGIISVQHDYIYHPGSKLLKSDVTSRSKGNIQVINYKRPQDVVDSNQDESGIYTKMLADYIIEPVIEMSQTMNAKPVSTEKVTFSEPYTGLYLPQNKEAWFGGSEGSKQKFTFRYNELGNVVEIKNIDGVATSFIWSYNGEHPVAKIVNADYQSIENILGVVNLKYLRTEVNPTLEAIKTFVKPLRSNSSMKNAQVTIYSFKPLVGMTNMVDVKGQTTTYEYDEFQRLKTIRDSKGHIVKQMDYHYQNQ